MSYLPVENVIPFAFLRIMRARGIVNSCKFTFFLVDSFTLQSIYRLRLFFELGRKGKKAKL